MPPRAPLPIDPLLPGIRRALAAGNRLVLVAAPGAGKTTVVPLSLLGAPWCAGRKLIVLEPRRLATRAAARRMAALLGERVGETVGYRMRLETIVGPRTRLEVVTEGVLTRMLREDPTLSAACAVLFDEFHERSLNADLGLALTLHAQRLVREDLRIVVMSATLDGGAVARAIDAPLLASEGRAHPVATYYRPRRERERVESSVAGAVAHAIATHEGDVLAFLPGAGEIRRTAHLLEETMHDGRVDVRPLYGDLPGDEQDAAIVASQPGHRKVVLATNIAETSLTIDGVRIVVDGGLARAPRFSARTGLTRLELVRISRASADQRRGRAGRTSPGVCYRLWSEADDAQLAPRNVPEILEADLAALAIELAAAGIDDPATLTWLDAPPAGALAQARALLAMLGALENPASSGAPHMSLTSHGERMAELPVQPRLAHLLLRGRDLGHLALASDLTALLGNRDVLRAREPGAGIDADLRSRLEIVGGRHADVAARVDGETVRRVRLESRTWRDRLAARERPAPSPATDAAGLLLSFAYPDRIARRRAGAGGRYLLANGTGAHFAEPQPLGSEEWLVVAETDGRLPESRIFLAAPVALGDLVAHHARLFTTTDDVRWDADAQCVVASRRTRLGAIVVREQPHREAPSELIAAALLGELQRRGTATLPWSDAARRLRERLAFARHLDPLWPDVGDAALTATLEAWLAPALADARSIDDVARADLGAALLTRLTWQQRAALEEIAPTHIGVPSGSRLPIDYADPGAPALAVRVQELYGLARTPTVAQGRVTLTLRLLSPAHRPVQVTRDLAAFWSGSYADVRREMRGRYPKHDWPDDPAAALPSRGRKKPR